MGISGCMGSGMGERGLEGDAGKEYDYTDLDILLQSGTVSCNQRSAGEDRETP